VITVRRIDPEHYYLDSEGRRWPSVTQILGSVPPWLGRFDHVPEERLNYKRDIGTAVHLAIALDAEGDLDEHSIAPELAGYLDAWRRYKAESGFVALWTEHVVWHPALGYTGTLDALGTTGGGMKKLLADAKTGSELDADLAGPQTAAYLEAARSMGLAGADGIVERCSVHLRDDGTYRVVPHRNRRDWNVFTAALELFNFRCRRTR
jgi:hypothetical protein